MNIKLKDIPTMPQIMLELAKRLEKGRTKKNEEYFSWIYGFPFLCTEEKICVIYNEKLKTVFVYYFGSNGYNFYLEYSLSIEKTCVDILAEISNTKENMPAWYPLVSGEFTLPQKIPIEFTQ